MDIVISFFKFDLRRESASQAFIRGPDGLYCNHIS
jgi:hypothetical protein